MQLPHASTKRKTALRKTALTALALTAGLAAFAHAPVHAQSLSGQLVNVSGPYPTKTTPFDNLGTQTVTPAGALFSDFGTNILVKPTQVMFTFKNTGGLFPPPSTATGSPK